MIKSFLGALLCAFALLSSRALAQTGTLDQVSPFSNANGSYWFNADNTGIVWQAQVRAGMSGQLEGFKLKFNGPVGSVTNVRVRVGDGWNTTLVKYQTVLTKMFAGDEIFFVNTLSANLSFAANATFVIEIVGNGSASNPLIWAVGTYMSPSSGPASYPEPLFEGGPGCFSDCGSRIGFETYMIPPPSFHHYCFGTGCPCLNNDPNNGCRNSTGFGAFLTHIGGSTSVAADNLVVSVAHLPLSTSALIYTGNSQVLFPFGDGLHCVGGVIRRYPLQSTGPNGLIQRTQLVQGSGGLITAGTIWNFQCWYRDPTGPCGQASNFSNALKVLFTP